MYNFKLRERQDILNFTLCVDSSPVEGVALEAGVREATEAGD